MKEMHDTLFLISVIIPAYNAEAFIKKAIDSALLQSYVHFEVIVVNDGSTDCTESIVKSYTDPRVKLVSQSNGGLSNARNTGIRNANGTYLAFLDADDYWLPEKLNRQIKLLTDHPEIGFCSTQTRVETPDGALINIWPCPIVTISALYTIFEQNAAIAGSGSSVMVKKDLQMKAGFFDESLRSLEDIDMWMRYAALSEYCCVPETLTVITKRPDSMSRNLVTMKDNAIKVLNKNKILLNEKYQGAFWRSCYASMLCDYAKWEARSGLKYRSIINLLKAFVYAPFHKGRLSLGLLIGVLLNKV